MVLEKTLESLLDCKEIQPVHSKGDQPWVFFGRNDAKAETPVLWPPHAKSWLIGKDSDAGRDWGQEEMAGWHHWLDGREFGWTPGIGDGQGGWRAAIHGVAKSWTWLSNWTELNQFLKSICISKLSWNFLKNTNIQVLFFHQSSRYVSNEQPCLKTTGLYEDLLLLSSLFHFFYFIFSAPISFSFLSYSLLFFFFHVLSQAFINCSRETFVYIYI